MNKFLFKSTTADFQKFNSILETIQKNILYITYQEDKILKIVQGITTDKVLQKQVDEYFEDDETSPQTDPVQDTDEE